jgi:ABC-type Mn2+/Zn2+ transport system permease subunit
MITPLLFLLATGAFVGAASGYLGSFMVLKRMALVGDALSHVALPGMALALMFKVNPMLGAFVALFIAVLAIWHLQNKSPIYPEALVGIFFTGSLALGILFTPQTELLEALFGDLGKISPSECWLAIVASLVIIILTAAISKKLTLGTISEELAHITFPHPRLISLTYYLLVGAIVAIGVRFVGSLLMGALVIIPAAAAKNLSRNLFSYGLFSTLFGITSSLSGILISQLFSLPPGPIIVLTSVAIFLFSYLVKPLNR